MISHIHWRQSSPPQSTNFTISTPETKCHLLLSTSIDIERAYANVVFRFRVVIEGADFRQLHLHDHSHPDCILLMRNLVYMFWRYFVKLHKFLIRGVDILNYFLCEVQTTAARNLNVTLLRLWWFCLMLFSICCASEHVWFLTWASGSLWQEGARFANSSSGLPQVSVVVAMCTALHVWLRQHRLRNTPPTLSNHHMPTPFSLFCLYSLTNLTQVIPTPGIFNLSLHSNWNTNVVGYSSSL